MNKLSFNKTLLFSVSRHRRFSAFKRPVLWVSKIKTGGPCLTGGGLSLPCSKALEIGQCHVHLCLFSEPSSGCPNRRWLTKLCVKYLLFFYSFLPHSLLPHSASPIRIPKGNNLSFELIR